MTSGRRDHFTLFFVHGGLDPKTGEHLCPACAEAAPLVEAYAKRHPEVVVEEVDLATVDWKARAWAPRLTPTLVILKPSGKWLYYEGAPTEAEFVAWVSFHIPYGA